MAEAPKTEKRYIMLTGTIEEKKADEVMEKLIEMNTVDCKTPIMLVVDSYGGHIDAMWAIIDAIKLSVAPVYTLCMGKAMSAGFMILLSGEKGRRYITPHARAMMHEMSSMSWGRAHQLEVDHEEDMKIQKQLEAWVVKHTNMDAKFVKEKMKIDFYMTSEEAKKFGVVDGVVESFSKIPLKKWK